MKNININIPQDLRKGQYIFNLLEFIKSKGVSGNQNQRLADTFYISDEDMEEYIKEFNKSIK